MSGGFASSGFEIGNELDRRSYPTARPRRTGPPSPSGDPAALTTDATPAPPVSRVIPFVLSATANNRMARSAGPYRGPAIITGLHFAKSGTAKGAQGLLLGKSASPISENNVANTTPKAWTRLFEPIVVNVGVTPGESDDTSVDQSAQSTLSNDPHLGIVIPDADFHLVIAIAAGATGTDVFAGHVTLLERVSAAALAALL